MPLFGETIPKFNRREWRHWSDLDGDGEDTRQEILKRDSKVPVTLGDNGLIKTGLWLCMYSGRDYTAASKIDIDHVISLGEAHRMGGHAWDSDQKKAFANDPDNLLAVSLSSNRSKSDIDSFDGMPPNINSWGRYMIFREAVVEKYGLTRSKAELNAIKFYRDRWHKHRNWIKMGKVRLFMGTWIPGTF